MFGHPAIRRYSPVKVPNNPNWEADYSQLRTASLIALTDEQLCQIDPLAINLLVAKDLPKLRLLEISKYQLQVNIWANDFRERCLPLWEPYFHEAPRDFDNDLTKFRLGMMTQYLDLEVGIRYRPELRQPSRSNGPTSRGILYDNPGDLFYTASLTILKAHAATWPHYR